MESIRVNFHAIDITDFQFRVKQLTLFYFKRISNSIER